MQLRGKLKRKRSSRYQKIIKKKKTIIFIGMILAITLIILISFFTIEFIYGYTFTDRSMGNSSVKEGIYYGKENSLKFNDPDRGGLCFADLAFQLPYGEGVFSFYVMIRDKSQLNLNMEFVGSNGIFYKWQNIQDHVLEENKWYQFDYKYNCANSSFSIYVNGIITATNNTFIFSTTDFSQVFIKTNDKGIAELYINIISLS